MAAKKTTTRASVRNPTLTDFEASRAVDQATDVLRKLASDADVRAPGMRARLYKLADDLENGYAVVTVPEDPIQPMIDRLKRSGYRAAHNGKGWEIQYTRGPAGLTRVTAITNSHRQERDAWRNAIASELGIVVK